MKLTSTLILALALTATTLLAGYIEGREAAVQLLRKGETQAAIDAFQTLAAGDVTQLQQSDALEQVVLGHLKLKQLEEATAVAAQIPLPGVSALSVMRILAAQDNYQAIIDRYGDEDIGSWPTLWRGHGYLVRAQAAQQVGNGQLAADDLEKAVIYAATFNNPNNDETRAYLALGSIYRDLLDAPEKAIDAFRRGQNMGRGPKPTRAAIELARVYLQMEKPEQAVEEMQAWLEIMPPQDMPNAYWQKYLLGGAIGVYADANRPDLVTALCQHALSLDKIKPEVKEYLNQQLAEPVTEETP